MPDKTKEAIQKSTDYYNSSDTDNYYRAFGAVRAFMSASSTSPESVSATLPAAP